MLKKYFKINTERLLNRIEMLSKIGATKDGGCTRIALTDADKESRDLITKWMNEAGLNIYIDQVGNIHGLSKAENNIDPVMTGSHIDTVVNGGKYDGNYGVIAGLEVIETLYSAGIKPYRPLCVSVFSNEEGVRFQPDMFGSLVYSGGMPIKAALNTVDNEGISFRAELKRIGYAGNMPCGQIKPHAYVELHIEQGPILEEEDITIGVV